MNAQPIAASARAARTPPWTVPIGLACSGPAGRTTTASPWAKEASAIRMRAAAAGCGISPRTIRSMASSILGMTGPFSSPGSPASEAAGEKLLHLSVVAEGVPPVAVVAAMALVGEDDVTDVLAGLPERRHHLLGLADVDARVLRAVDDQQGTLDPVRLEERRFLLHAPAVLGAGGIAHVLVEERHDPELPVGRHRLVEGHQVRDAHDRHAAGEHLRRGGHADETRVAAVAGAVDRHPRWVGDAGAGGPPDGVDQVVVHPAGVLADRQLAEGAPVAGGASVVHLEDSVAAVREELNEASVAPIVSEPVSAVHEEHQRSWRDVAGRPREVAVETDAVASGERDGLGRTERVGEPHHLRAAEEARLLRPPVDEVVLVSFLVEHLDGHPALVGVEAEDMETGRDVAPQALEVLFQ